MTDAAATARRTAVFLRVLARIPGTLTLIGLLLAAGLVVGGLWRPFDQSGDLWNNLAYGLPALQDGRWWTPVTGTFLVHHPWVHVPAIIGFWGMGFLEYRRGTRVALAYFGIGQLFAIFASALFVWAFTFSGWPWAIEEAQRLDVGPSGGTMACVAAAIGLFASPWRARAWFVLLAFVFVEVTFWGTVASLEHVMAVLLVLFVDRSLRVRRTTVREQRLLAFLALVVLGALEIIVLLIPTDGPFGKTTPASGSFWDVAIDVVIVALVATGLRRGRLWAWVVSLILAVVNVLTGLLLITIVGLSQWTDAEAAIDGDPSLSFANAVLWAMMLGYLVWVRRAFRTRRRTRLDGHDAPSVDAVKELIRSEGGGTLSWMTTWDNNRYFRTSTGIVAYQRRAGVAIALGDPLGPEDGRDDSVREFIASAEHIGLVPAFFSAGEATKAAVPAGWRSLVVADDTIVDLPGLQFTGKRWNSVRTSLNRAGREEMTFRLTRLSDEPWGIQAQIRAISEMWVSDKDLPEMGFTLGSLAEAEDPEVRLAVAISPRGDVDGFLSWMPIYGRGAVRGWTLDLMRRRDGGFGPVIEYLIGSSAVAFRDEGAEVMSLSGAPLAHDYPPDAGIIADLSDKLGAMLEPVYGFQSLHRFKEKFHPRYETMYLLYRDESDLTRIGAGLTRAFLPNATLRQFAGAGLELVRGTGGD